MSLTYSVMYRLGVTPWEHQQSPRSLVDLIEGDQALPPGRMLDVGCGTGGDLVYAARHGWEGTGVDAVPRALSRARQKARDAGVEIRLLNGDIAAIDASELGDGYRLVLDGGCLHGLSPSQRERAGATITAITEPGALLLMFAFSPGRRGPLPRGLNASEVADMLPRWDITYARPATDVVLKGAVRNAAPMWYQLRRR
jgi:SAM-dependent methyltransferase